MREHEIRLLALDGGGVRGLSSLQILKQLMNVVNPESPPKPCDYFDMIGGTSTGGLIAIMLGRLQMTVDECIDAYVSLSDMVFQKQKHRITMKGKVQGQFDSIELERAIKEIIVRQGLKEDALLKDSPDVKCKIFVCATSIETGDTVRLTSYRSPRGREQLLRTAKIWEAGRATSATSSFFDAITIGEFSEGFVDGATGANNPVYEVWNEARDLWPSSTFEESVKCFVSIGTGVPSLQPFTDELLAIGKTLLAMATETEKTAERFCRDKSELDDKGRYYRFNVLQGLEDIGLEESKRKNAVLAATNRYLESQAVFKQMKAWGNNLTDKKSQKVITLMPHDQNYGLVNRDEIFKNLDRLLTPSLNRSLAIWGLGGCGKTQIAIEYAYRCQEKTSCSIFWIHADPAASFTQDFSAIAKEAALSSDLKGEDLLSAVKLWIENQKNWLLILDNADDLGIFKNNCLAPEKHLQQNPELLRFVPRAQTGTVIWTSRDGSIVNSIVNVRQGIEVGPMTNQEALDLFRTLSGRDNIEPSTKVDELLDLLGRLPLAIAQAAAYIRQTHVSVGQYLISFHESESRQLKLLDQAFLDPYRANVPNSVMRTWLITMERIRRESPCGERILDIVAFLDNKNIPFELVGAAAGSTFDEDQILLAAGRLIEYSFLQVQRAGHKGLPTYEQHRLVHLATRQTLTKMLTSSSFSGEAIEIMTRLFPAGTHGTWSDCTLYLPHALKATAWRKADGYNTLAPPLLEHVFRYYWEQGRFGEAEAIGVEVLKFSKEVLGTGHPDTIRAMANLAATWGQQGRSGEAETLEVEVLKLFKEVLGTRHPDTITTMANLAATWRQQGRSGEAEPLQVEVLKLSKEVLGTGHPDTIRAMANLAATWGQQGRSGEAETLEVEVLKLRKEVLDTRHPDTIRAMANLLEVDEQSACIDQEARSEVLPFTSSSNSDCN